MDKKLLLESLKGTELLSTGELITELAGVLPYFAGKQQKYGVSTYPDERTIRYYMNEGLIDKPVKYRGASGIFSYRHILQVLAVKCLQAQYFPLNKIKEILPGLSEQEMEAILLGSGRTEMMMISSDASSLPPGRISARRNRALDEGAPKTLEEEPIRPVESPPVYARKQAEEWLRIPVSDGVELNIRADSLPGPGKKGKDFTEKLSARVRILFENEKNRGGI